MYLENKRLISLLVGIPVLLMIPYVAMQFSTEVHWTTFDFVTAGILLLSMAAGIEWTIRKIKYTPKRNMLLFGILMAFLFIWIELAVGIIGTPLSGN